MAVEPRDQSEGVTVSFRQPVTLLDASTGVAGSDPPEVVGVVGLCTVTEPVIDVWIEQKYVNVPRVLNVFEKVPLGAMLPESNEPPVAVTV